MFSISKFGHHLLSKSAPRFERAPFDCFFRPPVLRLSPQPPVRWIDPFIRPVEPPDSKQLSTPHLRPPLPHQLPSVSGLIELSSSLSGFTVHRAIFSSPRRQDALERIHLRVSLKSILTSPLTTAQPQQRAWSELVRRRHYRTSHAFR